MITLLVYVQCLTGDKQGMFRGEGDRGMKQRRGSNRSVRKERDYRERERT